MRLLFLLALLPAMALANDDVVGWRVDGSGLYLNAEPPTTWSADQNIEWQTKMSNWSNAQPIMVDGKLFVHAEPSTLVCVDAKSGKVLWEKSNTYADILPADEIARMSEGVEEKAAPFREELERLNKEMEELWAKYRETEDQSLRGKMRGMRLKADTARKKINEVDPLNMPAAHDANGYTSSVPVSDGKHVYAVYGNGVVVCYDLEGNRVWGKLLEKPNHVWGHSATPVLVGDTVVIHILDVVGLDAATGEERWRTPAAESWGSPVPVTLGDTTYLWTAKDGDLIRVKDGEKVREKLGGLQFATPVVQDGSIYLIEKNASRIVLPDSADGEFKPMWEAKIKGSRHYASSVIHDGMVYGVSREGWLSVLNQETGELLYEKDLGINGDNTNSVYPSVSLAGNHLYVGFEEGVVLVLKPGGEYVEVARNDLEKFRGTPLFVGDHIYLRGLENLYSITAGN